MEENLKNSLKKAAYLPETGLANKIWHNIIVRDRRIAYFKLVSFSFVGIASLAGLVPMFKILINDFTQSGFYEYLSLAFSTKGFLFSYWKEFAFSLAESLPTMSIVLSLALLFIFFLSLRYVMKQIINNNHIGHIYGVV